MYTILDGLWLSPNLQWVDGIDAWVIHSSWEIRWGSWGCLYPNLDCNTWISIYAFSAIQPQHFLCNDVSIVNATDEILKATFLSVLHIQYSSIQVAAVARQLTASHTNPPSQVYTSVCLAAEWLPVQLSGAPNDFSMGLHTVLACSLINSAIKIFLINLFDCFLEYFIVC